MRRFIILYQGREGSSPLVDLLGRHPQITVPIFEELDWYIAREWCDSSRIHQLLLMVLKCGNLTLARQSLECRDGSQPASATNIVGFKWRAWGRPELVSAAIEQSGALVLHLFRANLVELAISLYFTDVVIPDLEKTQGIHLKGGGHLQFPMARMENKPRAEFQRRLHAIRFTVQVPVVVDIMRKVLQKKLEIHRDYVHRLTGAGIEVHSINYEDFVERRQMLIAAICQRLALDWRPLENIEPFYVKVNSLRICEQADNIEDLTKTSEVAEMLSRYHELVFKAHEPLLAQAQDRFT